MDRILDKAITKDDDTDDLVTHYLVKWAGLPHEEATWELEQDVDKNKVAIYNRFNKLPSKSERLVSGGKVTHESVEPRVASFQEIS